MAQPGSFALSRDGAGTRADYRLEVEPANLLGRLILAASFFRNAGRTFSRLVAGVADYAAGRAEQPYTHKPPALADDAGKRLQLQLRQIESEGVRPELARRLEALIVDRVLVTNAREAGAKVDEPELDRVVANIAAQNKLTLEQLRERLKADGMDYRQIGRAHV